MDPVQMAMLRMLLGGGGGDGGGMDQYRPTEYMNGNWYDAVGRQFGASPTEDSPVTYGGGAPYQGGNGGQASSYGGFNQMPRYRPTEYMGGSGTWYDAVGRMIGTSPTEDSPITRWSSPYPHTGMGI